MWGYPAKKGGYPAQEKVCRSMWCSPAQKMCNINGASCCLFLLSSLLAFQCCSTYFQRFCLASSTSARGLPSSKILRSFPAAAIIFFSVAKLADSKELVASFFPDSNCPFLLLIVRHQKPGLPRPCSWLLQHCCLFLQHSCWLLHGALGRNCFFKTWLSSLFF